LEQNLCKFAKNKSIGKKEQQQHFKSDFKCGQFK